MKYKILDHTQKEITYKNSKDEDVTCIVKQIQAEDSFGFVKNGDLGGWVENAENLSQEGECWICQDSIIFGQTRITGNLVIGNHDGFALRFEHLEDLQEIEFTDSFDLDPENTVSSPSSRRLSQNQLFFPR